MRMPYTRFTGPFIRLRARWRVWRNLADDLNRRAEVEQQLFDVAAGKRMPPSPDECRRLALRLGVPTAYRQEEDR